MISPNLDLILQEFFTVYNYQQKPIIIYFRSISNRIENSASNKEKVGKTLFYHRSLNKDILRVFFKYKVNKPNIFLKIEIRSGFVVKIF